MDYMDYKAYRKDIKNALYSADLESSRYSKDPYFKDVFFFDCIKDLYTIAIEDLAAGRTQGDTSYVYALFDIANKVERKDRGEGIVTLGQDDDEMQYIRGLFRDMFLHDLRNMADKDSLLQSRANHLMGSEFSHSKAGWLLPSDISDILSDLFKAANVSKDKAAEIVKEAFRTQGYSKEQQEEFVKSRFFEESSVFSFLETNLNYVLNRLGGQEGVKNEMNRLLQENIDLWTPVIGEDLFSEEIKERIKQASLIEKPMRRIYPSNETTEAKKTPMPSSSSNDTEKNKLPDNPESKTPTPPDNKNWLERMRVQDALVRNAWKDEKNWLEEIARLAGVKREIFGRRYMGSMDEDTYIKELHKLLTFADDEGMSVCGKIKKIAMYRDYEIKGKVNSSNYNTFWSDYSTKDIENFQNDVNEKYDVVMAKETQEAAKTDEIIVSKRRIAPKKPKPLTLGDLFKKKSSEQDKEPQPEKKPKRRSLFYR